MKTYIYIYIYRLLIIPGERVVRANDSCRPATDPHPNPTSTEADPFWLFSTLTLTKHQEIKNRNQSTIVYYSSVHQYFYQQFTTQNLYVLKPRLSCVFFFTWFQFLGVLRFSSAFFNFIKSFVLCQCGNTTWDLKQRTLNPYYKQIFFFLKKQEKRVIFQTPQQKSVYYTFQVGECFYDVS